ncbi:Os03g0310666, partial [Oryza sativa Japonica Group]
MVGLRRGPSSLFLSSASEQEESAGGRGAGVEGGGAGSVGEAASVAVPGGRGHDRSAVDGDGDELAHLCDFFLSFFPFFLGFSMCISVRIDSFSCRFTRLNFYGAALLI